MNTFALSLAGVMLLVPITLSAQDDGAGMPTLRLGETLEADFPWDGLLGEWGVNNFYLYRPADSTRAVLIPWDEDNGFTWLDMPPWYNVEANVVMSKAWASPALRDFYLRQLTTVSGASGWILEEIERESSQIRAAGAADPVKNSTGAEFEDAVDELTIYARRRGGIIRQFVAELAP